MPHSWGDWNILNIMYGLVIYYFKDLGETKMLNRCTIKIHSLLYLHVNFSFNNFFVNNCFYLTLTHIFKDATSFLFNTLYCHDNII